VSKHHSVPWWRRLWAFYAATRFLQATNAQFVPPLPEEVVQLKVGKQTLMTDIYRPSKPPKGTIVMIHGMNSSGARDPRMIKLCSAVARLGFIAVAPTFPSICEHLIQIEQLTLFRETLQQVILNKSICPTGKLSIFTASFSGGISVKASACESLANQVNAIMSVSITENADTNYLEILSNNCEDLYARLIATKNLYHFTKQVDRVLDAGLEAAIEDEFTYSPNDHLERYLKTLTPKDAKRVLTLVNAVKNADFHPDDSLMKKLDLQKLKYYFSFENELEHAPFKLFILQSDRDKIMQPYHALGLSKRLHQKNVDHELEVTPLLDHANMNMSIRKLKAIYRAIRLFAHYFFIA